MKVKINGLDITDYIAFGGFKWTRNDVDSPDTGRMLDGVMERTRVATKVRIDITCRPLLLSEASELLTAIMPVFVQAEYTDPQEGRVVTKTMYSNNNPASFCMKKPDGREFWSGIAFPLVEK